MKTKVLGQLLDMLGLEGKSREDVTELLGAVARTDGAPCTRAWVFAGEGRETIPRVIERLGLTVKHLAPMTPLPSLKDLLESSGRGLYVLNLPMDPQVRAWVSGALDDPKAQRHYVWAVSGTEEEVAAAGFK